MTPRRPRPARGGQHGYDPPTVRMCRDERILELALDRWSQRRIAAEVGLSQVGVSKALRRILRKHADEVRQHVGAYRMKLLLMTERRARVAREGHDRSCEDVTIRRQRKATGGKQGGEQTSAELETHSSLGNPHYLAVEQRCDEFAANLLGLNDAVPLAPATHRGGGTVAPADVRQISELTTETLERVYADLTRPVTSTADAPGIPASRAPAPADPHVE